MPPGASDEELVSRFQWRIPERFDMGWEVCRHWADQGPERRALIRVKDDGEADRWRFRRLEKSKTA